MTRERLKSPPIICLSRKHLDKWRRNIKRVHGSDFTDLLFEEEPGYDIEIIAFE